jgi:uncharacterized membrane protein YidH (DUF202 family)
MTDRSPGLEAGLSAQRTRLAWRRTAMSAAAVALLAVRPAVTGDADPTRVLAAAAAMVGWVALVAIAYRRGRGLDARPPLPGSRALLAYALVVCGFAAVGIVQVLA